jgi:hypothetical protein
MNPEKEYDMQARQAKEHLAGIERAISNAARLCQISSDVPEQVLECLGALDRESEQTLRELAHEQNDNHIAQCVDRLEKLGDRALHACAQAGNNIDPQVHEAVRQTQDALADLKHRLH